MASLRFTLCCPSENKRDVSGFYTEHGTDPAPSSSSKNISHVLLLCQLEELIVRDLSRPKDMPDFTYTGSVKGLHLLQIMHSILIHRVVQTVQKLGRF